MKEIKIPVKTLENFEGLSLPGHQTSGASGVDLIAAITEDVVLKPGERTLISTGLALALPEGIEAQIRPRSGLAVKHGITMLNSPGTIDSDYRGEVKVIVVNLGQETFTITRGMRIAQMVIAEVIKTELVLADNLTTTLRGSGGFGHTGQ